MAKFFGLLLLVAFPATSQIVEGTVLDAATKAGAPGVKVELLKGGTAFYETFTDGAGHFRFDNLKAGDYAARYRSPNYWLTAGESDYKYFHVAEDSRVKLESRLMPWSRIAGRVVDPHGRPVAKTRLEITGSGVTVNGRTYLRTSWGEGGGGQLSESALSMTFRGETGADGRFEILVMPGSYGLSVLPPLDAKPPTPEPDGPALAWKRVYYPDAALPAAASKIVVLPGSDVLDLQMKLLAVPARAVRGVVVDPEGRPLPKINLHMGEPFSVTSVASRSDGTFEFPAVPEGEWLLVAESQAGTAKLRATHWVEVGRYDLENLKLRLVPPLTLRGSVLMEAPKDTPSPRPIPLILSLRGGNTRPDEDFGPAGVALLSPDAKGDFIARDVFPGVYGLGVRLQSPPAPYYLDAVRVGGADLLLQDVEITSDTTVTVVYKTDGGSVAGKVENCASGGVVLVPRDPTLQKRGFSKAGPCDANGRYEIVAVRPGDYYVLAFAGNGLVVPLDDAMLSRGAKVTVRAGEASSADVGTVTRPIYE